MYTIIALDTEYNNSNESKLNVICAVICFGDLSFKYNLLNQIERAEFEDHLKTIENPLILSYVVSAEARSLISLDIDPLQFQWIDLYVEFRLLCNSNNKYNYGNYIDSDGNIQTSYPPKFDEEPKEDESNAITPKNLINALYKMCGVKVDSKQKDEMRNVILSKNDSLIQLAINEIMDYCESDTKHLIPLYESIKRAMKSEGLDNFFEDMIQRGRYAASMAVVENNGLPIDMNLLNKIIDHTPKILAAKKEETNKLLPNYFVPEIQREPKVLKNGRVFTYKVQEERTNTKTLQDFIQLQNITDWPLTDSGKYKTDRETLQGYSHIPEIKEILSFNNLDNNLKWFKKDNKNGFFEHLGSDNNIRPWYGIFGTQTGRNAAKAKTFPLAMGSWLRCIIRPPEGKVIVGCDFSQQEIYVAAILSKDKNLLNAYNSGDVYLWFGKYTGIIPEEGNKKTHEKERDMFKNTVLGEQFGMGKAKLHKRLISSSGDATLPYSMAEKMDRYHKDTFSAFWDYTYSCSGKYKNRVPLITSDGWVLWQDNPVMTSVRNFMIQGTAAAITRKAIILLIELGIDVIAPLHDAIYVLCSVSEQEPISKIIENVMLKATEIVLNETKTQMRVDTKIVTHDKVWIEGKGIKDWDKLKIILGE